MLNYILNDAVWTPYGIQCSSPAVAKNVHKFLREAVLDRHIYISKVIGFAVRGDNGNQLCSGTYIARHINMGDSYPELSVVYSDKVFLTQNKSVNLHLHVGGNNISELACTANPSVEVLYVNDYAGRALTQSAIVCLQLMYSSGYRSMADNSKVLSSEFFPCNTDFSLQEFVRVLPFGPGEVTNVVPVRFYNNMTQAQFRDILTQWLIYSKSSMANGDELKWMHSFEH